MDATAPEAASQADDDCHAFLDRTVRPATGTGPLAGLTVAIKDNICVEGMPCTAGSRILEGWMPPYDATVVQKICAAGATIVGKTNMDEFGMGSSTENSAYGPTLNPHDHDRIPGGSSGGSAVAVAAGLADLSFGSDTGGSVRLPAALTGIVGLKPTYGLVSRYGLIAYASSLDTIGPLARTVRGAALGLSVIAGHDPMDSTSIPGTGPTDYTAFVDEPVAGLRIGIVNQMMGEGVDPGIAATIRAAADRLTGLGAEVVEVDVSNLSYALSAYYLIATAEASSNLARYDGVRYGLRVDAKTTEQMMIETRTAGFGAETKRRIMLGTFALSAGYHDQYYGRASRVRTVLARQLEQALDGVDLLMGPTAPLPAFRVGERVDDPLSMYLMDICTVTANLVGYPAISVPADGDDDGMPIGVQFLASPLREDLLLRAAAAVEATSRWVQPIAG